MVNIHKCKDCGKDIYYKPKTQFEIDRQQKKFGHLRYMRSVINSKYRAMNLDKTLHFCHSNVNDNNTVNEIDKQEFIKEQSEPIFNSNCQECKELQKFCDECYSEYLEGIFE